MMKQVKDTTETEMFYHDLLPEWQKELLQRTFAHSVKMARFQACDWWICQNQKMYPKKKRKPKKNKKLKYGTFVCVPKLHIFKYTKYNEIWILENQTKQINIQHIHIISSIIQILICCIIIAYKLKCTQVTQLCSK